jgi:predicted  nucleic acid-binding Zn-ribbon protein
MAEQLKRRLTKAKSAVDEVADGTDPAEDKMDALKELGEHVEDAITDLQAAIDEEDDGK